MDAIAADLDVEPADRARIVLLGDYVDRGPDSAGVVKAAMGLPRNAACEHVFLRGNHEDAMARFLRHRDEASGRAWLTNGGVVTLESYGVDARVIAGLIDRPGKWLSRAVEEIPEGHLDWLDGLPLTHEAGDYVCVHAGVRPGRPLERQAPEDLLWIRGPFLDAEEPLPGRVVVHGHTPTAQIVQTRGRIGVDTGAVYGGALSAIVLEGRARRAITIPS